MFLDIFEDIKNCKGQDEDYVKIGIHIIHFEEKIISVIYFSQIKLWKRISNFSSKFRTFIFALTFGNASAVNSDFLYNDNLSTSFNYPVNLIMLLIAQKKKKSRVSIRDCPNND